jgi:hypothetical protein
VRGRKITPTVKSPDRVFTDHPNSNSRFYAFPHENILIHKKGHIKDKNISTLSFSSSLG